MLDLDGDVFGKKMECVGASISGGGPPGAHETGGAPREGGRALHSRGLVLAPPAVFSLPKILKYSRKNHKICRAFGALLFLDYFLMHG